MKLCIAVEGHTKEQCPAALRSIAPLPDAQVIEDYVHPRGWALEYVWANDSRAPGLSEIKRNHHTMR